VQTIQDWGALGEVIGGFAVVFTIVYLALQVRRSTRATHRQIYHAAADSVSQFSLRLADDPALFYVFRTSLQEPDTLSPDDLLRGYLVVDAYFSLMEAFYLHNTEFDEQGSQQRWSRMLRRVLALPGGARYWSERRWQFHDAFAAYVDGFVPVAPDTAGTV
jgi:hypothetical protein